MDLSRGAIEPSKRRLTEWLTRGRCSPTSTTMKANLDDVHDLTVAEDTVHGPSEHHLLQWWRHGPDVDYVTTANALKERMQDRKGGEVMKQPAHGVIGFFGVISGEDMELIPDASKGGALTGEIGLTGQGWIVVERGRDTDGQESQEFEDMMNGLASLMEAAGGDGGTQGAQGDVIVVERGQRCLKLYHPFFVVSADERLEGQRN